VLLLLLRSPPLLLHPDLDAADRFAEIAGAVVNGTIVGGAHGGNYKFKLASGELKLNIAGLACAIKSLALKTSSASTAKSRINR
jgi:hypothetical protein